MFRVNLFNRNLIKDNFDVGFIDPRWEWENFESGTMEIPPVFVNGRVDFERVFVNRPISALAVGVKKIRKRILIDLIQEGFSVRLRLLQSIDLGRDSGFDTTKNCGFRESFQPSRC